ncbi:hypothetical protein BDZ85DRAFT_265502 [Elsinoe ampelina]|uniref:Uncharacterized protein n=1 Tax=Elsinoe ampelina TaxID=302913 RepID=A0A6A6G6W0_9PEZI|nr:hypothetical protein BDZ85DRAFT_265502 [Elsinoe ampelina]
MRRQPPPAPTFPSPIAAWLSFLAQSISRSLHLGLSYREIDPSCGTAHLTDTLISSGRPSPRGGWRQWPYTPAHLRIYKIDTKFDGRHGCIPSCTNACPRPSTRMVEEHEPFYKFNNYQ